MADGGDTLAAVRRKLNVTWDAPETEARIADVVDSVSPALGMRLGYGAGHAFTPADGEAWALFLNACLYEFSDALDDFWSNYAGEVMACRLVVTSSRDGEGGADAQG